MLPAVGQGAIGLECRADDVDTRHFVEAVNDPATWAAVQAERAMLPQRRETWTSRPLR